MRFSHMLSGAIAVLVAQTASADVGGYSVTTITIPGATKGLAAYGVNDSGTIIGQYTDSSSKKYAFFIDVQGNSKILDVKGEIFTQVNGINNDNDVVGLYIDSQNASTSFVESNVLKLLDGKKLLPISINYPGTANSTFATGVNNNGQITGYYNDSSSGQHAFVYAVGTSTFTSFNVPGALGTFALGINDFGAVAGYYVDSSLKDHGFIESNGSFTYIDAPGATTGTFVDGINNSGTVVGYYDDGSGNFENFVYSNGAFTTIDVPGATRGSSATGINNFGTVVGKYNDAGKFTQSFVAIQSSAVPEPSTWALMVIGVGGMGAALRARRPKGFA